MHIFIYLIQFIQDSLVDWTYFKNFYYLSFETLNFWNLSFCSETSSRDIAIFSLFVVADFQFHIDFSNVCIAADFPLRFFGFPKKCCLAIGITIVVYRNFTVWENKLPSISTWLLLMISYTCFSEFLSISYRE